MELFMTIVFMSALGFMNVKSAAVGPRLRQCDGDLKYKRMSMTSVTQESSTFYMNITTETERQCIEMCYEQLQFCYSIKYESKVGVRGGVCSFGYYNTDCSITDSDTNTIFDDPFNSKVTLVGCIRCNAPKPSFVQEFDELNNNVGPALLIRAGGPPTKVDDIVTTTPQPTTPIDITTNLAYREVKTLNYLLGTCEKNLTFSMEPTLVMKSPAIFTAVANTLTVTECAHICYRQQFCLSAIWRENDCLLSYQRTSCNVKPFPHGYIPAVLISCIKCA